MESLRTDLMTTKEERMRFELGLRNKDAELTRLQQQLDHERENREREERELRKQINYESDRHIQAVREAERNLSKATMNEDMITTYKKEIDNKSEIARQKDLDIEKLKDRLVEQERKFVNDISKEKDRIREELMIKISEKSKDTSLEDFKNQILSLTRQNEELIRKNESLLTEKEMLSKELLDLERSQNESSFRVKELNLKYQNQITDLEKKIQEFNITLYKKEALIAKITTENEFLSQENFRIKSAQNINDSIIRLPDTWFIDIQSAKKQREAVHEATKQLIEEMAEEKVKGREDLLLNNISLLEEKNK